MQHANSLHTQTFTDPPEAACIGIDWADRKHDFCLYDVERQTWESGIIDHCPEKIDEWVEGLRQRFNGRPIAICTELKQGPLIYALCKYDFLALYPVNPRTVARYRAAFKPSGAKDDPTDAAFLEELLRKHRDRLQAWEPQSAELRMLAQLVESRRTLVEEKVRLSNRIIAALKNYFPQVLDWFVDKDTQVFCNFITQYPTLKAAQAASSTELTTFFRKHKVVRKATIERRLKQVQEGRALTEDISVVEPLQLLVETWVQQLKLLLPSIQTFDAKIAKLFKAHPDANLFASFPGAGPHLAPRLLVALGEDRRRYPESQDVLRYVGIAPVKEKSSKKEWIHWRYSCPKFLRQTFVEWANRSRNFSFWASEFYDLQRQRGKTHQMAIRSLAFKWIRILFRCWQERQPYDEAK
ncbi:MAG: IS110 family transposase, partial [Cyanobacteria bacterium J06639_1]